MRKNRESARGRKTLSAERRANTKKDALDEAMDGEKEISSFARMIVQGLPWTKFCVALQPPIEANLFNKVRNVAVLTEALHFPDKAIVARVGCATSTLKAIRGHQHYETIAAAVRERAEAISAATDVTSIARANQLSLGNELVTQALTGTGSREQLAALAELVSRSDPKVSRTRETRNNTVVLPADLLNVLSSKVQSGELSFEPRDEESPKLISGARLAVPKKDEE